MSHYGLNSPLELWQRVHEHMKMQTQSKCVCACARVHAYMCVHALIYAYKFKQALIVHVIGPLCTCHVHAHGMREKIYTTLDDCVHHTTRHLNRATPATQHRSN